MRADVITCFADLFRGTLEQEYSHVWDVLASDAVDLYATTLADDIRGAYEAGLLWPGYMGPKEREKIFAMQEETVLARSRERCGGLIDDVVKEMHWGARRSRRPCAIGTEGRSERSVPLWQWEEVQEALRGRLEPVGRAGVDRRTEAPPPDPRPDPNGPRIRDEPDEVR